MLEVLLGSALRARGVEARVHSSGTQAVGGPAVQDVVDLMAERGHDLDGHVSRPLDLAQVQGADLVLGLAREHLREVVVTCPDAFSRTFTPRELVRRAAENGGRVPGEPLADFLARLHEGRVPQELLRADPVDDVPDPIGGPWSAYSRTADELEHLSALIADLLVPAPTAAPSAPR